MDTQSVLVFKSLLGLRDDQDRIEKMIMFKLVLRPAKLRLTSSYINPARSLEPR